MVFSMKNLAIFTIGMLSSDSVHSTEVWNRIKLEGKLQHCNKTLEDLRPELAELEVQVILLKADIEFCESEKAQIEMQMERSSCEENLDDFITNEIQNELDEERRLDRWFDQSCPGWDKADATSQEHGEIKNPQHWAGEETRTWRENHEAEKIQKMWRGELGRKKAADTKKEIAEEEAKKKAAEKIRRQQKEAEIKRQEEETKQLRRLAEIQRQEKKAEKKRQEAKEAAAAEQQKQEEIEVLQERDRQTKEAIRKVQPKCSVSFSCIPMQASCSFEMGPTVEPNNTTGKMKSEAPQQHEMGAKVNVQALRARFLQSPKKPELIEKFQQKPCMVPTQQLSGPKKRVEPSNVASEKEKRDAELVKIEKAAQDRREAKKVEEAAKKVEEAAKKKEEAAKLAAAEKAAKLAAKLAAAETERKAEEAIKQNLLYAEKRARREKEEHERKERAAQAEQERIANLTPEEKKQEDEQKAAEQEKRRIAEVEAEQQRMLQSKHASQQRIIKEKLDPHGCLNHSFKQPETLSISKQIKQFRKDQLRNRRY